MKFRDTVFVLCLSGIFTVTYGKNFYVAAPKMLRLNAEETVFIAMDGTAAALVNINVQDHPQKKKTIVTRQVALENDKPKIFTIRLDPIDFPPNFFEAPDQLKYVSLTANFQGFTKEIVIPVTSQSGYMFIQTDKPIYTPRQRVLIRMIPVSEEIRASKEPFQLVIKNPKNITIEVKNFNEKFQRLNKAFVSHVHKFPSNPILGEWSAIVRYGHNMEHNSTVHFTVKEYVLPTFTVELTTPDAILPKHDTIDITVQAKHVYGRVVKGIVNFRLGVKKPNSLTADIFGEVTGREVDEDEGTYNLVIETKGIKNIQNIGWFPKIEGSYLFVEATVVDAATGNSETAIDVKGRFSTTPFLISFDRCLTDFKPGLTSVFEADLTYFGGSPATEILTKISAVGDDGKALHIAHDTAVSDENGKVTFEIHPEMQHTKVTITLETIDEKFKDSQAKETFEQNSYKSTNNAYLAISRSSPQRLRPGDVFGKEIHFQPPLMSDIYYMVIAKGKILDAYKLPPGRFKTQRVEFQISYDMIPSFRVLAFAHYQNELIVDSLKIDVESICHPNAQVTIKEEYKVKAPAQIGKIIIKGKKGVAVGLLGVDEAIYALSKRDLLTKAKLFNTLGSHDLGCGPGGGLTTESVLGNAGITMGTNKYTPSKSVHSCTEKIRKKREIPEEDIADQYEGVEKECCLLIREPNKFNRTCEERAAIIEDKLKEILPSCVKVFMECCRAVEDEFDDSDFGRTTDTVPIDFVVSPGEMETMMKELTVRSDFRETWLFEDIEIGPEEKKEIGASLPHSITTWVLQAVALSPEDGMCVAEPRRIESFKAVFLHLNLPYSVVRNEQVEIQATVFNYGSNKIYANIYMYGTADLCSGSQPGERSETKTVLVEPQSAATVTFPVIPMEVKHYPIKVFAMTSGGHDAIERQLHVVPEGITKEIDIPVKLDPTNIQRRTKRDIQNEYFTDQIDPTQNLQVTAIQLGAPEGFVPGTASCYITAMGDTFGPAVETSVKDPNGFINLPRGCGEQNMMGLAPTLYSINYLKATDKLTADIEEKGLGYIRTGYSNELYYRKDDGSFSTYPSTGSSTWLTAFVIKVFCQASKIVVIDRKVLCSGVKWLIENQEADGSYTEKTKLLTTIMGGVKERIPFTAFVLITFSECDCDEENLTLAKQRAIAYLEAHINEIETPHSAAIVSYALALVSNDNEKVAIEKLLALAKYDEDTNRLYWQTPGSAQDIETAGYALMAFLISKDMSRSNSIVNWLNAKQMQSGAFKSTQDTVVALQALSKYSIDATAPVNLVSNITSSHDGKFLKVLTFNEDNSLMLQDARTVMVTDLRTKPIRSQTPFLNWTGRSNSGIDKVGGTIFIKTAGQGQGTLTAKLRYNMIVPPEDICKFEVTVQVTEVKDFVPLNDGKPSGRDLQNFPESVITEVRDAMGKPPPGMEHDEAAAEEEDSLNRRVKRQNPDGKEQYALNIALCVRYLGNKEAGMSIVDVGTFSGFEPYTRDLKKLQDDEKHLIKMYETSSRSVVFYLDKVPTAQSYCFSYHVLRKFYIGNTQMSSIKVYDYYNPDETCTKFYRPDNDSPMMRTICEDGKQCQCAEGGCPPEKPFSKYKNKNSAKARDNLISAFCETYDFVWKGRVKEPPIKQGNGFLNITFVISEVVKPGIEKTEDVKGKTRTLLTRDNCNGAYFVGVTYLIAGNDGKAYQNEKGILWYRYMLDKTTGVYLYGKQAEDQKLQRDMEFVTKYLVEKGCDL